MIYTQWLAWNKRGERRHEAGLAAIRYACARRTRVPCLLLVGLLSVAAALRAEIVYETYSVYHHIQVVDEDGVRILSFNGSMETRMSLSDPLKGHFEYTEFFHLPWLWNPQMKRVLMIGLGGGSTQRAYQHYYPDVHIDTAELDPVVVRVAKEFFHVKESPTFKIYTEDGRLFLRRATNRYDAVIVDAYTSGRYGSYIPYQLATQEFFQIATNRMTRHGVLAYNVIGSVAGRGSDIVAALYRTLKTVFPQVYLFPALSSENVVLIATRSSVAWDRTLMLRQAEALIHRGRIRLPTFRQRVNSLWSRPPSGFRNAPILTDDRAPLDGLLRSASE